MSNAISGGTSTAPDPTSVPFNHMLLVCVCHNASPLEGSPPEQELYQHDYYQPVIFHVSMQLKKSPMIGVSCKHTVSKGFALPWGNLQTAILPHSLRAEVNLSPSGPTRNLSERGGHWACWFLLFTNNLEEQVVCSPCLGQCLLPSPLPCEGLSLPACGWSKTSSAFLPQKGDIPLRQLPPVKIFTSNLLTLPLSFFFGKYF